ncbi:MAG: polymer-forming cytoskeletal protein [Candidatus Atribacteria bacterium]|nr:polymer-forming cytoskeletal protein [Candidatus Atribacteria bacterium]
MKNDNRGSMLIITFFIVVALATILTTASFIFIGGKRLGGTQAVAGNIASLQAHYMAEMGIEEALSSPFLFFQDSFQGTVDLGNGTIGKYGATVKVKGNTIELQSTGLVNPKNQSNIILAQKTVICKLRLKPPDHLNPYVPFLKNAITTHQNLKAGKIRVDIDFYTDAEGNKKPVASSADIYSNADVEEISGVVKGSVIAQGNVKVTVGGENTTIEGDVLARGSVDLTKTILKGKVISANGYVQITNDSRVGGDVVAYGIDSNGYSISLSKVTINGDVVAYGADPAKKYSVWLTNQVDVGNIYTQLGETQVNKDKKVNYLSIGTVTDSGYPSTYKVEEQSLPTVNDEVKNLWITKAQSDGLIFEDGLSVTGSYTLGNAFINGRFVVGNNANNTALNIQEGSIIYVTEDIEITNNALISVVDTNGDGIIKSVALITNTYFDVGNNAVPVSVSLVALGNQDSLLSNNSLNEVGVILVPNGNLKIKNKAKIYGGIFAKSILNIGNNTEIYFNPLENITSLPPITTDPITRYGIIDLVEWQES